MNLRSGRSRDNSPPFEEIYEQYYGRVFNFVYMRLLHREDAEDVTAETFTKAFGAYDRNDPSKASILTWLCTIARNCLIDHVRKSHKGKIISFDRGFDTGAEDPELERLNEDTERRVYRILKHLNDEERELLSMRYKMDLEYSEIGGILGIEPKTAAKRVERLLKKCRDYGGNEK